MRVRLSRFIGPSHGSLLSGVPTRQAKCFAAGGAGCQRSDFPLRDTGIDFIGEMPWGMHLCVFYETETDLLEALVSYCSAGLRNNEFCVLAISEPITISKARNAFRRNIPNFERYFARGQIEIVSAREWYLKGGRFEMERVVASWDEKLNHALAHGYDGLRASGNAFWLESKSFRNFTDYEYELDHSIAGRKILLMCTYSLRATRAMTVLDVVRAHHFTMARRHGTWEPLEKPELRPAQRAIAKSNGALGVLADRFPHHELLTQRERSVLAHIVTGSSSKEVARRMGIGARTVEFHRANIMRKLEAKNIVDLVHKVLGEGNLRRSAE